MTNGRTTPGDRTKKSELPVIARTTDLLGWTLRHLERFPRSHRYGLGLRIETKLYDLLDLLIDAKFTRQKQDLLRDAATTAQQLRILIRTARDLRILAMGSHRHACIELEAVAESIQSWRRYQASRGS